MLPALKLLGWFDGSWWMTASPVFCAMALALVVDKETFEWLFRKR
jgi:hypothetical protein